MSEPDLLHEAPSDLESGTRDQHRGIRSLMEEFEAIDWYAQRVDAALDPELKAVLGHNRDEEKEHAAMVLEWLRRQDPTLDGYLRQYLFTEGSILDIEIAAESKTDSASAGASSLDHGSLGIGSLHLLNRK